MPREAHDSIPVDESLAMDPGVIVERRSFFGVVTAALLPAFGFGRVETRRAVRRAESDMTLAEFLKETVPLAKQLVGDVSSAGQDRYLHTLASFAARLGDVPVPEMKQLGKGTFIGANEGGDPFVVLHWRMEPGSVIRPHPHLYGNVCTVGLEGEAMISNYEVIGGADLDTKATFRVRRTQRQVLGKNRINLVNLEHGYVHGFIAGPKGARGLDITTRVKPKRPTPTLEIAAKPVDPDLEIYEASWGE